MNSALSICKRIALTVVVLHTALLFSVSSILPGHAMARTYGLQVEARTRVGSTERVDLYSGYYALVIGCSDYRRGWPSLPNPVKDAQEIANALKGLGWEVDLLTNPEGEQMKVALNQLVVGPGQDPEKAILVWYSGHGETLEEADGTKLGYLVPVDAPLAKRNEAQFMGVAIDMRQIETIAKRIRSKHVLMAFDSCFSGAIFSMVRAAPSEFIQEKVSMPVREFITAGREDEKVPDKSMFKTCFIQAIQSRFADRNEDGYVTGEELGSYLQEKVVNYTKRAQHPQFGKINNPNLDKGDFVFIFPSPSTSKPSTQGTRRESETLQSELAAARQDLEAERLRHELEQARRQLDELKQLKTQEKPPERPQEKPASSSPTGAPVPEKDFKASASKPAAPPQDSQGISSGSSGAAGHDSAGLPAGSPTEKLPAAQKLARIDGAVKPGKEAVAAPPTKPVPSQGAAATGRKALILPWSLKMSAPQYAGILSDGLTEGLLWSKDFEAILSYYDPKGWPSAAALSRTAPELSLSRLWPDDRSVGGLNVQEICRIGRMLGVDIAIIGSWRVKEAGVDIDSEGMEVHLIDVQTGQVQSFRVDETISIYHGEFKPYLVALTKKMAHSSSSRR